MHTCKKKLFACRKETRNYNWANSACSILAEVGTLHMEFAYLSRLTGEPVYENKVQKIRALLNKQPKVNGLYRNYINPLDGSWCGDDTSVGALGDSFYEYLLKDWLRTGRSNAELRNMFDEAVEGIRSQLSQRSASGFFYFGEMRNGAVQQRVDHLSCFFGGTLALGAQDVVSKDYRKAWFNDAVEFTRTCHESYVRTATHIGPDAFYLTSGDEFSTQTPNERAYLQRPEVIESYFYLWRLTHNETYREWAWDAALAIEKHCRAKGGYSGLRDVYTAGATHDDVQQSFFLAETLKYLYLIFSPDTVIPLKKWVFNTEAHPFPVEA
jgi:mannosyl-oligosaccharide alpha-1,2-mannosidase